MRESLSVLLVQVPDDDVALIVRELHRGGFAPACECAHSAPETEKALGDRSWDVIIAGCSLPEMTVAAPLGLARRSSEDVPFIVVSDRIGEEMAVETMKAGAYDLLVKDNLGRLPEAVRQAIREGHLRQERRMSEATLRDSEEGYRQIFEAASDAIFVIDNETGRILNANTAASTMYGCTHEELLSRRNTDLSAEPQETRRATLTPPAVPTEPVHITPRFHRKKDGTVFPVDIAARFFTREGRSVHIAVIRDITERRRAEEALRDSEEKYRLLVQNANEAIYVVQRGTIVYANPHCVEVSGIPMAELVGTHLSQIVPDDEREWVMEHHLRLVDGAIDRAQDTFRILTPAGVERWIEVNAVRVTWAGHPATLNLATDVTERRRADTERLAMQRRLFHTQKMESLGVLAGGVAHDFNNLLTAITGNMELARQYIAIESPAWQRIEQAIKASRRAASLTQQMLAYAGKGRFVFKRIDVNQLVLDNVDLIRASVPRSVELDVHLCQSLPVIAADSGQVHQVITNLVTNAAEAIGDQPGRICLTTGLQECNAAYLSRSRVEEKPASGPYVFLEVSDTGCGMDDDTVQRLFEPFFTTKFAGRGLGMSAVLGIVRSHHGAIIVDSKPGAGTTVRVLFPASDVRTGAIRAVTSQDDRPVQQD